MRPERPRKKILFFDWRDVALGGINWKTPEGKTYFVGSPEGEFTDMHADPGSSQPHGIRLQAQPARKAGEIDDYRGWIRVIWDHGRYKTWYFEVNGDCKLGSGAKGFKSDVHKAVVCAAESEDGFHWSEPVRCELDTPGQHGFDGPYPFIDPNAPPDECHKLLYCSQAPVELAESIYVEYARQPLQYQDIRYANRDKVRRTCLYVATSPDGHTWKNNPKPLMMHCGDTDNTLYWDDELQRYVMYTRSIHDGRRTIGRAETDDLAKWGPILPCIAAPLSDPPDYDVYLNGFTYYPGYPEYRLMFPMIWKRFTERSEVRLYSTGDGMSWNAVPGGAVIEPGEPGEWDSEFLGTGKDLVPFGDGRIGIAYTGTKFPHKYPRWQAVWDAWKMGWAWWPEDRLCAIVADYEGEFCTFPLKPEGRQLKLNFRTPQAGEVKVGIIGVEGRSVADCDPMHGDCPGRIVTWKGNSDIGSADGQPVTLQFKLRCAELFALEWV